MKEKKTKQVRINSGIHRLLKIKAAESRRTLRGLIEESLTEVLAVRQESGRK